MEAKSYTRMQTRAWNAQRISKQMLDPFCLGLLIGTVYYVFTSPISFKELIFRIGLVIGTYAIVANIRRKTAKEIARIKSSISVEKEI